MSSPTISPAAFRTKFPKVDAAWQTYAQARKAAEDADAVAKELKAQFRKAEWDLVELMLDDFPAPSCARTNRQSGKGSQRGCSNRSASVLAAGVDVTEAEARREARMASTHRRQPRVLGCRRVSAPLRSERRTR